MSVYVCNIKTHTERTRADFLSLVALFLHIEFPDHSANELRQFRLCKCFSVGSVVVVVVDVHLVSRFW